MYSVRLRSSAGFKQLPIKPTWAGRCAPTTTHGTPCIHSMCAEANHLDEKDTDGKAESHLVGATTELLTYSVAGALTNTLKCHGNSQCDNKRVYHKRVHKTQSLVHPLPRWDMLEAGPTQVAPMKCFLQVCFGHPSPSETDITSAAIMPGEQLDPLPQEGNALEIEKVITYGSRSGPEKISFFS